MDIRKVQSSKFKVQILKNTKILITAGPTWVPIDKVRVISNIATGETGILLARKFQQLGAKVTLLLGPAEACCLSAGIRVIRFKFFDELRALMLREIKSRKYDCVVHCAAVSDYRTAKIYPRKVSSGKSDWKLDLVPAQKLIDIVKRIDPSAFLVGFKFRPQAKKNELISQARKLLVQSKSDLIVANTKGPAGYRAYLVDRIRASGAIVSKNKLAERLSDLIGR